MDNPSAWVFIVGCIGAFFIQYSSLKYNSPHHKKIPSIPSTGDIKIEMEIDAMDADGTRWKWAAYVVQDDKKLTGDDYQASGIVKDETKAWERAREAADDARARYAAEQIRRGKRRSDVLPL